MGFLLEGKFKSYTKKDQKKADIANAYIGYGVKNTSTFKYLESAIKQNIPFNENIVLGDNVVAFVSVNGGNRPNMVENREKALTKAIEVIENGGTIVMDCDRCAYTSHNISGEGWVQTHLSEKYTCIKSDNYNIFKRIL